MLRTQLGYRMWLIPFVNMYGWLFGFNQEAASIATPTLRTDRFNLRNVFFASASDGRHGFLSWHGMTIIDVCGTGSRTLAYVYQITKNRGVLQSTWACGRWGGGIEGCKLPFWLQRNAWAGKTRAESLPEIARISLWHWTCTSGASWCAESVIQHSILSRLSFVSFFSVSLYEAMRPLSRLLNTRCYSSAESQKGANTVQRCSVENQKGAITIDFVPQ